MALSDESDPPALSAYPEEILAALEPRDLIALMVRDEDRVPRNVIDACARHGGAMVAQLRRMFDEGRPWKDSGSRGEWWLTLHAAMILGRIPDEQAGLLLVAFMLRMSLEEDYEMQDWLAGWWPALFLNKPAGVIQALREQCRNRSLDWYARANALGPVIAAGEQGGSGPLDEALAWAAAIAADATEDWELRLLAGSALLDFVPTAHRPLLDKLAALQTGPGKYFSEEEVKEAYAASTPKPEWRRWEDPWRFYRPGAIARRQDRWAMEDAEDEAAQAYADADDIALPYVRELPKIGRNDPCPCGSGKKYKKCCLARE